MLFARLGKWTETFGNLHVGFHVTETNWTPENEFGRYICAEGYGEEGNRNLVWIHCTSRRLTYRATDKAISHNCWRMLLSPVNNSLHETDFSHGVGLT